MPYAERRSVSLHWSLGAESAVGFRGRVLLAAFIGRSEDSRQFLRPNARCSPDKRYSSAVVDLILKR